MKYRTPYLVTWNYIRALLGGVELQPVAETDFPLHCRRNDILIAHNDGRMWTMMGPKARGKIDSLNLTKLCCFHGSSLDKIVRYSGFLQQKASVNIFV